MNRFDASRDPVTILNVDDNAAKRYALTRQLQAAGFRVLEAASGASNGGRALPGPDRLVELHPHRARTARRGGPGCCVRAAATTLILVSQSGSRSDAGSVARTVVQDRKRAPLKLR